MSNQLTVTVQLNHAKGLSTNHNVVFNGVTVGNVKQVKPLSNGVEVVAGIDKEASNAIVANAAAIVLEGNPPALQIVNGVNSAANPAQAIADGAVLTGLNDQLELAAWQGGAVLGGLQSMLQDVVGSVQNYFSSDDWQRTRSEFQQQVEELGQQSQLVIDQIGGDLELLLQNLESESAEAMNNAATQFQQLEEKMQDFQQQGESDAAEIIRRMLEGLNAALQDAPGVEPLNPKASNGQGDDQG